MNQQHRTYGGERGASATEYALLIAGVSVMLVVVIVFFGNWLAASLAGFSNNL